VKLYIDLFKYLCYHRETNLRFDFRSRDLLLLYTEERNARRYPPGVIDSFFEVMAIIAAATNENDIRAFKSLRFEKLSGERRGQYSLRLNKQYRLIIQIETDETGKLVWIIEIVDYH
jgi:toxin HigB-1